MNSIRQTALFATLISFILVGCAGSSGVNPRTAKVSPGSAALLTGQSLQFTTNISSDPTDWFYAQHGPSFTTQSTAGKFGLAVFDNGDDRMYPNGETCAQSGAVTCPFYSSAQVLNIDENAKTAAFVFHDILANYSNFGGNAEVLADGHIEFDLCSDPTVGVAASSLYEVTPDSPPLTVLQITTPQLHGYRIYRLPSLYPGVQW